MKRLTILLLAILGFYPAHSLKALISEGIKRTCHIQRISPSTLVSIECRIALQRTQRPAL